MSPDSATASTQAARYVASLVRAKPGAVLGLATGGTPLRLYAELARLHREEDLDFSQITTFNLDEYVGLGADHPASYRRFMQEHFFSAIPVASEHIHIPDGLAADISAHCLAYENSIVAAGGMDLQILGVGSDGHIGFNEPSSSLASRTRLKTLTERTRRDNAVFFGEGEEVPHHVITMGIGTILGARQILLLAFGSAKAQAVADFLEGPITASVPASILQMHPVVKVFLDEEAAALLKRKDYYRQIFANKPDWQKW